MKQFKSSNYIFHQTAVGAAFAKMGIANVPLVREPKLTARLRAKGDQHNQHPSHYVHLDPVVKAPGAFGKEEVSETRKRVMV